LRSIPKRIKRGREEKRFRGSMWIASDKGFATVKGSRLAGIDPFKLMD